MPVVPGTLSTVASVTAAGSNTSRTFTNRFADIKNVMDYGAVGDGTGAALSTRFGSVAAAQAVYPQVTSLTQSIDWAALKAAVSNITAPYSNSNRGIIFFPQGIYQISEALPFEAGAAFTGTITGGTTLTVSSVEGLIEIGQPLSGSGVTNSPIITGGSGTTWTIAPASANVGPVQMVTQGIFAIEFVGAPGAKIRGDFADALLRRQANSVIGPVGGIYRIANLELENNNAAGKCIVLNCTVGSKVVCCQLSSFIGIETWNSQSVTIDSTSIINGGFGGNSIGVIAGNATTLIATDVSGFPTGLTHYNAGLTVIGGRFEVNTVAFNFGVDQNGTPNASSSVLVTGVSLESNGTGIAASGGLSVATFAGLGFTCSKPGKQAGINFTGVISYVTFTDISVGNSDGATFTGTITGGTTLTVSGVTGGPIAIGQPIYGAGVTNSPVITGGSGTTWTISPASANVGPVAMASGGWSVAGINIAGGNYVTLNNVSNISSQSRGGITLFTGTNGNNKVSGASSMVAFGSAWTVGSGADVIWDRCPDAPIPTLAQLPAASAVAKGSRRIISDATSATPTFGGNAAGTGSNVAPVWSDQTNWRYG